MTMCLLVNRGAGRAVGGLKRPRQERRALEPTCYFRRAGRKSQVDPLFRLPTTWRLPLSPLSYFLRRRGPVFLVCKS
jgi:hypothetical protein